MKKQLAALLAVLTLLPSMAACSQSGDDQPSGTQDTTAPATETDAATESTEPSRENTPDGLPADLNFDGQTVCFASRDAYQKYVVGEDGGDIMWSAIYDANLAVDERLNIKREIVWGSSASNDFAAQTAQAILANSFEDDIIEIDQYYGSSYAQKHVYANMMDTKYIDFSQPWWYNEYMNNLAVGNDTRYFLGGDIAPLILAWSSCTFFNQAVYRNYFGDPSTMYEIVDEGKWTVDKLREMCQTVYQDLDGDNQISAGDMLGYATSKGQSAMFAALCAGAEFSKKTEDGTYEITADSERNIQIFEKIYQLYNETPGVYTYDYSSSPEMYLDAFVTGKALFMNEYFKAAWEGKTRDMKDSFGVIPRPKMDEQQENYRTAMQDSMYLFTVPRTLPNDRMDMVSAVLEAQCAENYRRVFPAMFESALKVKYNRDEANGATASRMIDLIYNNLISDFAVVYDASLANIANQVGALVKAGTPTFASTYAALSKAATKGLAKIEKAFLESPES